MSERDKDHGVRGRVKDLLYNPSGVLTRDLLLTPGEFGLGKVPLKSKPDQTTTMVCGFCSTGCGLRVHLKDGEAVNLSPDSSYPVNLGMACPKGWEALTPLGSNKRGTAPLMRQSDGKMKRVSWDEALTTFCTKFKEVQAKHGRESVAFLGTGQLVTEELAYLGSLAKFGMGMIHGDGNTRQCMATAVTAYKESFGFDAPPYSYKDFEESDVLIFIGANPCIAHPIMWERVMMNRHDPEIVVIDPRVTETAMAATEHYPILPKSDLVLFYGLARILIERGWVDLAFIENHTSGYLEFARHVENFPVDRVSERTGIAVERIEKLAELIGQGKRVSFWWTMGVNQSYEGVRVAQSVINLALMTGNIGKPGSGANSITGQCNAMGSRLFSNTTNLLGGRDFTNADHRSEVANILGIDAELIPKENSLPYHRIVEEIEAGKIKGLWIICTNPSHSWINQTAFRETMKKLDFLVVQDMYSTADTVESADLFLPAAAWAEKEGSFINSERRFGLVKKVCKAPGEALADFLIFKLVARYWGCHELFSRWETPEDVFQSFKELSRGRPCDISGIEGYREIDRSGGIQWPRVSGQPAESNERRLFEDGRFYHADGRAKFIFEEPAKMPEPPDAMYPYYFLTGRGSAAQWHTQTRTLESPILRKLHPLQPYFEICEDDAEKLSLTDGSFALVISRRGEVKATVFVTPGVKPGQVFMPMHFEETNRLTRSDFDPYSAQPSYKSCAVRIVACII